MSNSIFYLAGAIAVLYLVVRFLEMRFILKENKFIDIGTPESLQNANFFFKDK